MSDFTFKVRGKWSDRSVACRVAMCIGVGDPLAWNDDDNGPPYWQDGRWQLNPGNDYWLRKIDEQPPDEISQDLGLRFPVRTFRLDYRYSHTPDREKALKALCEWLECDLVFGS